MIYLHCGWPKTGTTSLQVALVAHQDRLAEAGISYPEEWRVRAGAHRFAGLLADLQASAAPPQELERFLDSRAGRHTVLSSENLSVWMLQGRIETLLRFLAALREVAPVRCVWTLRRADELLHSVFRQMTFVGRKQPGGAFLGRMGMGELFDGMLTVEEEVDEVTYVKYDSAGRHNAELLRAFDLPPDVVAAIEDRLGAGARLNPSVTEKVLTAVVHADRLSERAGVSLGPDELRDAFRSGFRFDDDRECMLASHEERRCKHERALMAAEARGFAQYLRFFAGEEVEDRSPVARLDPDAITERDLDRLVAYVRQPVSV